MGVSESVMGISGGAGWVCPPWSGWVLATMVGICHTRQTPRRQGGREGVVEDFMLQPWFGVHGGSSVYGYMGGQRFWVTSQDWKGSGKCPRVQWFRHKCIPSI